jgi:hypothetical protein
MTSLSQINPIERTIKGLTRGEMQTPGAGDWFDEATSRTAEKNSRCPSICEGDIPVGLITGGSVIELLADEHQIRERHLHGN